MRISTYIHILQKYSILKTKFSKDKLIKNFMFTNEQKEKITNIIENTEWRSNKHPQTTL